MNILWTTIFVKNMEESLKFYQDIVGLPIDSKFTAGSDTEIYFLGGEGAKVELIYDKKITDVDIGKDVSIGFAVNSIDEKIEFLKKKGIEIQSGPFQPNPHTRFFFIQDPNGMTIQFVEEK
ncbi:MAG: VOC family protein [Anaerovoracaceae bacterium]|nr:VOC family protein [Clostridiales bacterium]